MSGFSKLRVGLIGCGTFGDSYLAGFAGIPFAEVTAVTDVIEERARNLADRYRVGRVARDFRELCSMKEIDAVCVVTTEDQHLEPVLAAVEQGKHVLVEKPMATRVEDAEKMLEAARTAGVILMPGHLLRFEVKYASVKQELESGRLGRVIAMHARRNRLKKLAPLYKRTHLVLEISIHDIDAMLWFTGKKVQSVRSYEVTLQAGSGPDFSCATLRFEDGSIGLLQTAWLLPDRTAAPDDWMQVITTSGVANIDVLHSGLTFWREEGHEVPDVSYEPRFRGVVYGALREELSYFALCALEGRAPAIVTAEEGVEAVRVAVAAVDSSRFDREIYLSRSL